VSDLPSTDFARGRELPFHGLVFFGGNCRSVSQNGMYTVLAILSRPIIVTGTLIVFTHLKRGIVEHDNARHITKMVNSAENIFRFIVTGFLVIIRRISIQGTDYAAFFCLPVSANSLEFAATDFSFCPGAY
jgi:hypothetical protein